MGRVSQSRVSPSLALDIAALASSVEYIRFVTARFGLKKFDTDGATATITISRAPEGEREGERMSRVPSDIDFVDAGNKTDLRPSLPSSLVRERRSEFRFQTSAESPSVK